MNSLLTLLYEPNSTPTVALNSPADASSGSDTTPTLNFTGTDTDSDAVEYEVQIDTQSDFHALDFGTETCESGAFPLSFDRVGVAWGAGAVSLDTTSKVTGTKSLKFDMTGEASVFALKTLSSDSSDYRVRFKLFLPTGWDYGASGYVSILILRTNADADVLTFNLEGDGTGGKRLVTWNSITSSYVDTGIDISVGTVHTIEVRFKQSTTVGEVKIWVDTNAEGSPSYNSGSINTGATAFRKICFGPVYCPDACSSYYMDDFAADSDFIGSRAALIDALSASDAGFTAGHPFASGSAVDYTVQSSLPAGTYHWRVRAIDPSGSNTYGAWSSTRSFTITNSNDFALADETSSSSIENISLTQSGGTLAVEDESSTSSAENVALVFNGGTFAIADEAAASSIGNIQLIGELVPENESSASSIENVVLSMNGGDFTVADESSESSVENIQLIGNLQIADESSASSIESITLEIGGGIFTLGDIACPSTIDNVGLEGNLIVDGMTCAVVEDTVTIVFNGATFSIDDINTDTSEENITLQGNFKIDSINSPPTIDNITLEVGSGDFSVEGMTSASSIGNVRIIKDIPEELKIIIIANTGAVCKWIGGNYYIEL